MYIWYVYSIIQVDLTKIITQNKIVITEGGHK